MQTLFTKQQIASLSNACSEVYDPKEQLPKELAPHVERSCCICGCTQFNACEGGCYWVSDNLCSKCMCNMII